MNKRCSIVALVILWIGLATASFAEDAKNTLNSVARALGSENLKMLHYSGTGSSYVVTQGRVPAGGWPHSVMKSYVRDVNLDATASRLELIRVEGTPPSDKTISHVIDANSPWSIQYEFWITPHGFVKGAMANNATVEFKTVFGTMYRVITFTLPGNHKVVGYINDNAIIEKVETWIGDNGEVLVEAFYRDYSDFHGVKFPTLITEKHAGELSLILVVKDVKPR